jgi:ankyrin repeat protein
MKIFHLSSQQHVPSIFIIFLQFELIYMLPWSSIKNFISLLVEPKLFTATRKGDVDMIEQLLSQSDEDVNQRYLGKTALHMAAIFDKVEVTDLLIRHGAMITHDTEGRNIMMGNKTKIIHSYQYQQISFCKSKIPITVRSCPLFFDFKMIIRISNTRRNSKSAQSTFVA